MKLNVKALALTLGIVWGASVFIMAMVAKYTGYGIGFVSAISTVYIGEGASMLGAVIGAVWGFFDAAIGGLIIGLVYNKLAK